MCTKTACSYHFVTIILLEIEFSEMVIIVISHCIMLPLALMWMYSYFTDLFIMLVCCFALAYKYLRYVVYKRSVRGAYLPFISHVTPYMHILQSAPEDSGLL